MTTISENTTIGITLSSPAYVNPVIVDAGVNISSPVYGVYAKNGVWTIQNDGTNNFIIVNPPTGSRFYRLSYP